MSSSEIDSLQNQQGEIEHSLKQMKATLKLPTKEWAVATQHIWCEFPFLAPQWGEFRCLCVPGVSMTLKNGPINPFVCVMTPFFKGRGDSR